MELIKNIDEEFNKYFSKLTQKQRVTNISNTIEKIDGVVYTCSYFGYIYENIDEKIAIEDFANEVAKIYEKYTILAQLAPVMKMQLASTPKHNNRYALLHYMFIKEFPNGAYGHNETIPFMFSREDELTLKPRMSGEPRKNIKVFIINHENLLINEIKNLDDFSKVKTLFKNLPQDLEYVETLAVMSPSIRVLCRSNEFPVDEVLEEYYENKQ